MPGGLTGNYFVRILRPAFHDAHKWLPRTKDRAVLRRHALKLRFWPERQPEAETGEMLDLNWSWIRALRTQRIGELRIDDRIGDCDNLRVIFHVPQGSQNYPEQPMPTIWVLGVLQKKRNDFSKANFVNFKARRQIVLTRFYRE